MSLLLSAFRSLSRSPGYVCIALLTLALGIGVNTAMFSLVDAVLFDPAPFPEPTRLVQLMASSRLGLQREFAEAELREIRAQAGALSSLSAFWTVACSVSEPGQPVQREAGISASADLFTTFGIRPQLGRAFTEEETRQGKNQVVLLGHAYWQRRFAGSRDVLGRTLRLDGESVTIIGVMPPSVEYPALWGHPSFWRPLNFSHDQLSSRDYRVIRLVGRLQPGFTASRAAASLAPLAATQQKEFPQRYPGLSYRITPLRDALLDDSTRRMYWMLPGLAGFVLLIACANLANLQLVRSTAGLRDLAIRAALGASRSRLIVQQLTESLLLSLCGGVLGLLVAYGINGFLERNLLAGGGLDASLSLNVTVLVLTMALSFVAGLLFGLLPAWIVSGMDLNSALKQRTSGASLGRRHHLLRNGLIVSQVALALVLLAGAGLLQRGFSGLLHRQSGWDTDRVLTAGLPLPENRYDTEPKRYELFHNIEQRLAALPGIEHAALCSSLPLEGYTGERPIRTEGQAGGSSVQDPRATHVMVTSGYFATLGIPFLEGNTFAPGMKESDPLVIIINETLARKLWPGQSALGRRIRTDDSGYITWSAVVGVVRDVDNAASFVEPGTRYQIYKPLVHEPWAWANLVVRSQAPSAQIDSLRRCVSEVDPDLALTQIMTVRQFIDWQHHNVMLVGRVLGAFSLLGMLLASIGLFSVVSHTVSQRTHEFGIRLALGARPEDLRSLVLGFGLRLAGLGLTLGLIGALGLGLFLTSLLPRLHSVDPLLLFGVSLLLFAIALVSCWLPARRATQVDPMQTLRSG